MDRVLVIDGDHEAAHRLGLAGLARGVAVALADSLCEGIRVLLNDAVSLIVVDAGMLRLGIQEHATLFERMAPGVPVAVVLRPGTSLETRVALEFAGFHVVPPPAEANDLLKLVAESA